MTIRAAVVVTVGLAVSGGCSASSSKTTTPRDTSTSRPTTSLSSAVSKGSERVVTGIRHSLQWFVPSSATTWWAVVSNNLGTDEALVRTADRGRHWRDVSPVHGALVAEIVTGTVAWLQGGTSLYRTTNGGTSWRFAGKTPGCRVQFLDELHGWCDAGGAASGSESVVLWRTTNGGITWKLVSQTAAGTVRGTPDAIPFPCDKGVTFTSATVGWAPFTCNGGQASLYATTDGGSTWHPDPPPPFPPGVTIDGGGGYGNVVAHGGDVAVVLNGGSPRTVAIATSADAGRTWNTRLVPDPHKDWTAYLLDPSRWRLTDGRTVESTDDAGRRWHTAPLPNLIRDQPDTGIVFALPDLEWAISYNGGRLMWWTTDGNVWRPFTITVK